MASTHLIDGHHVEVTPSRKNEAGETVGSALFHCVDCKTGFLKSAVRGEYSTSTTNQCPAMEQLWNELRPAWRRKADLIQDRYFMLRHSLKIALWRLRHG